MVASEFVFYLCWLLVGYHGFGTFLSDSQNNNNQIFNNNDNSNMNVNMVSMAMGRGGRTADLYSVLCHLLTVYLTGQGLECVDRVLCQAAPSNVSDLNTLLMRITR